MRHNLSNITYLPGYPLKLGTLLHEVIEWGWVGFKKSYVIYRVGQAKILCLLIRWVGRSIKGPKYAYVLYERSLVIKTSIEAFKKGLQNHK